MLAIKFMILGAWLLVLLIAGAFITFYNPEYDTDEDDIFYLQIMRMAYLSVLVYTMYELGAYFGA